MITRTRTLKPRPCSLPQRQGGNILLGIMVVMLLVMLTASTLVNHFAVSESRAIDENLAETQAYWAMIGALDFSISSVRQTGNDYGTDVARIADLTTAFSNANATTWTYEDSASVFYGYNVSAASITDLDTGTADDGWLRILLQLQNPGSGVSGNLAPALAEFHNRAPTLQIDLCMGDLAIAGRTPPPGFPTCQDAAGGDNTLTTITDLRRI